jgi:hypothetical protein
MPRKQAADAAATEQKVVSTVNHDSIYFHVGEGQRQWREAVLNIPIGAPAEMLEAAARTVTDLNNTFPLSSASGINAWYNNAFVSAYISTSAALGKKGQDALQQLLVVMAEKNTADPGSVLIAHGKKYANLTIEQLASLEDGADYITWLRGQLGTDVTRILAAYDAYMTTRGK